MNINNCFLNNSVYYYLFMNTLTTIPKPALTYIKMRCQIVWGSTCTCVLVSSMQPHCCNDTAVMLVAGTNGLLDKAGRCLQR